MRLWGRPRLFLSYARTDASLAQVAKALFEARGFAIFVDTERMLVGESFVRRIVTELRRVDGVVALLTPASISSPWCQAELHHAHALGKELLPIRVGLGGERQVEPLEALQRDLHFGEARDAGGLAGVFEGLGRQLDAVTSRHRRRVLARIAAALAAAATVAALVYVALDRLGDLRTSRERAELLERIASVSQPLGSAELDRAAARFEGDEPLLASTLRIARDATAGNALRLNAILLASRLVASRNDPKRWVIAGLDWRDGNLRGAKLVDVNFQSGRMADVELSRTTLAGVVWQGMPTAGRSGFELAQVRFDDCDLLFNWFVGTKLVDVRFVNAKFRGSTLDVTNWSLVSIVSESSEPPGSMVITPGVSVFENGVILNRNEPPRAGVLDLGNPKDEVHFKDVVFDGVHFRGWIRPEWFENCSFDRCVFPTALTKERLEAGDNRVEASTWRDEALD